MKIVPQCTEIIYLLIYVLLPYLALVDLVAASTYVSSTLFCFSLKCYILYSAKARSSFFANFVFDLSGEP